MRKVGFGAIFSLFLSFSLAMGGVKSSAAQSVVLSRDTSERAPVPSRIVKAIDDVHLVRLTGNTHPLAQQRYDQVG